MPSAGNLIDAGGVGLRIQMIRGKMTQQELAKKLGIKQSNVSRYEKGRIPNPEVLLKIAQFANVSIEWLLTGKERYHHNGFSVIPDSRPIKVLSQLDKRIMHYLPRLTESDKRILLKIIRKMLSY